MVNGSFEDPTLSRDHWTVRKTIAGWNTKYGPGFEIQHIAAGEPFHKNQLEELDSHRNSGIYQDLVTVRWSNPQLHLPCLSTTQNPSKSQ
ncbi:MAG: hypothetical protein VYA34_02155 [Myxococcota bacterium]|nr:hypothetical protein [Myxococcota bacterium]